MAISDKQRMLLAFPYTKYSALIADGAVRSGKTSVMTVSFIDDAMRRYNGYRFGICGKTVDSAVKNIIVPYLSLNYAKEKYGIVWRRSDKELIVSAGNVSNVFEVFGGKDESSFALIQGRTLAGVLIDEVVLQPQSFVEQACLRCSVDGSKLWFNCNPGSPRHWFYTEWIQKAKEKNALHLHFTLDDNPALSEEIKNRYRSMYADIFYRRYVLGEWCTAEGAIYRRFADTPDSFIIPDDVSGLDIVFANVGVDFGGGKSAHAFNCSAFTRGLRDVITVHDYRRQDAATPEQLYADFISFIRECRLILPPSAALTEVYADSAEQTLIGGMITAAARERLGVNIHNARKYPINDRIRFYTTIMGAGRYRICRHCEDTIAAFSDAVWNAKAVTADVRLDDGSTNIDSLDAQEYSTEAYMRDILERRLL